MRNFAHYRLLVFSFLKVIPTENPCPSIDSMEFLQRFHGFVSQPKELVFENLFFWNFWATVDGC